MRFAILTLIFAAFPVFSQTNPEVESARAVNYLLDHPEIAPTLEVRLELIYPKASAPSAPLYVYRFESAPFYGYLIEFYVDSVGKGKQLMKFRAFDETFLSVMRLRSDPPPEFHATFRLRRPERHATADGEYQLEVTRKNGEVVDFPVLFVDSKNVKLTSSNVWNMPGEKGGWFTLTRMADGRGFWLNYETVDRRIITCDMPTRAKDISEFTDYDCPLDILRQMNLKKIYEMDQVGFRFEKHGLSRAEDEVIDKVVIGKHTLQDFVTDSVTARVGVPASYKAKQVLSATKMDTVSTNLNAMAASLDANRYYTIDVLTPKRIPHNPLDDTVYFKGYGAPRHGPPLRDLFKKVYKPEDTPALFDWQKRADEEMARNQARQSATSLSRSDFDTEFKYHLRYIGKDRADRVRQMNGTYEPIYEKIVSESRLKGLKVAGMDPVKAGSYVHKQNGGTCSVVSQQQLIAMEGKIPNADCEKEERLLKETAQDHGWYKINAEGTHYIDSEKLLNLYGLHGVRWTEASEETLIYEVADKPAIAYVDAGYLWNNEQTIAKTHESHAVLVTAVAMDPDNGKVLGYFINDSGYGLGGRFVTREQFSQAWTTKEFTTIGKTTPP